MSTPPPTPQGSTRSTPGALGTTPDAPEPRRIAFFDVDKTITAEDTFLLLVKEGLKGSPWRGVFFMVFCPLYMGTALSGAGRSLSKGASLWALTVGRGAGAGLEWTRRVIAAKAKRLLLPEALTEIRNLEASGFEVVFVTASAPEWIEPLLAEADLAGRALIGSRLRRTAGGWVIEGPVCYGEEKLSRIEEALGRGDGSDGRRRYVWERGYSDSHADAPMLERCRERILVDPPARHLAAYAARWGEGAFRVVGWRRAVTGRRGDPSYRFS